MSILDIILLAAVGVAVLLAVRSMGAKRRSGGCHGCGGECTRGQSCCRR